MKTGISKEIWIEITGVFENFPKITQVIIFGSRAMGTFSEGSDIDLAVKGDHIELKEMLNIEVALEVLELLYKIDLVDFNKINNPELKTHIERVGIVVYQKNTNKFGTTSIKTS